MKHTVTRRFAAVCVATFLSVAGSGSAFAAETGSTPSNPTKTAIEQKRAEIAKIRSDAKAAAETRKKEAEARKAALAAYKVALEKHRADLLAWGNQQRQINETFKTAVQKAQSDFAAAMAAATDDAGKQSAKNARKSAVDAAAAARQQALAALGAKPVKPVAPVKPTR